MSRMDADRAAWSSPSSPSASPVSSASSPASPPPLPAPWLVLVGLGEEGWDGLGHAARAVLGQARRLLGGQRHLALVPESATPSAQREPWPSPFSAALARLEALRDEALQAPKQGGGALQAPEQEGGVLQAPKQGGGALQAPEQGGGAVGPVCILASGDPLWYGIGATLTRRLAPGEMHILPAPSAFSLACARLGWPLADVETLTLHGRPLALLHPAVQPGARLLVLSADRHTPAAIAGLLQDRGYGPTPMTVLSHLGGPQERIVSTSAAALATDGVLDGGRASRPWADLNLVALACQPDPEARLLPCTPGLPDAAFSHDGQLTKQEIRAITLAALQPVPGQLLWDVGAGSGAVAIEWMRHHRRCRAIALERHPGRVARIGSNAVALGTPGLEIVTGDAPDALKGLPDPDAIFIGGGVSQPEVLEYCWQRLLPSGRLVANGVTLEAEARLLAWAAHQGGTLIRLAVSRAEPVGRFQAWHSLAPVTQYRAIKPAGQQTSLPSSGEGGTPLPGSDEEKGP